MAEAQTDVLVTLSESDQLLVARQAVKSGEFTAALAAYTTLQEQFPACHDAYFETASVLTRLRRFADLETLLIPLLSRFPHIPRYWVEYALAAVSRREWMEAVARCEELRNRFPNEVQGYGLGVLALRENNLLDAAETLALETMPRFPREIRLWTEFASVARSRRDWSEAAKRFAEVRDRFPKSLDGYIGAVAMLHHAKQYDEAAALLEIAAVQFPDDARVEAESARNACHRRDWASAHDQAFALRNRHPLSPTGYHIGIMASLRNGKLEEAEALAITAIRSFPQNLEIMIQAAWTATQRRDWDIAAQRWNELAATHSSNPAVIEGIGSFRQAIALDVADHSDETTIEAYKSIPAHSSGSVLSKIDDDKLLSRFESLGDNCEFGLVQRSKGLEPLGLLRWASTYAYNLAAMLETRFEGVGLNENTTVELGKEGEWQARDRRYFSMHTFMYDQDLNPDRLRKQMARRFAFLRNKLIEDLELGDKIFLVKRCDGIVSETNLQRIQKGLRLYGPNTLFYVRWPNRSDQAGKVEVAEDGSIVGYLAELSKDPQSVRHYAAKWIDLCQSAWRLAKSSAR